MSYYKGYQNKIRWTCLWAKERTGKGERGWNCEHYLNGEYNGFHACHNCAYYEHK